MMLNITFQGHSADYPLEGHDELTDDDVRRVAIEVIRAGGVPGIDALEIADDAFVN